MAIAEAPLPINGMYEHLAFHAQQAAEKAIKATLVLYGIDFPKTHNIEYLLSLLPTSVDSSALPVEAYKLTSYATVFRYPGDAEPLTEKDSAELTGISRKTLAGAKAVIDNAE